MSRSHLIPVSGCSSFLKFPSPNTQLFASTCAIGRPNTYHILHCHIITQLESIGRVHHVLGKLRMEHCGLRGLGAQLVESHIASFHRHRLLVSGLQLEAAFRIALNQKQSLSSKSPPNLLLLERLISGGTISLFGKLVNISAFTGFFAARISLCIISYPISYL
jgi:hypothetical protein